MRTSHNVSYSSFHISVAVLLSAAIAHADSLQGTWVVILDNDTFTHTDGHYSNGFQMGWLSGALKEFQDGPIPDAIANGINALPLINDTHRERFISHSLSHRIFTPTDTEATQPVLDDMPYSAIFTASLSAGAQDLNYLDAYTLDYGITGPSVQGELVQNQFHRMIGANKVNGWDNQIHDELLLNIGYEHRQRLTEFGQRNALGGDLLTQFGGKVGNLISMATIGVGSRFGWGVPDNFGTPPQFFGDETIGLKPVSGYPTEHGVWCSIFINGTAVGNAVFWNGNTFKDSLSVDFKPFIARLYAAINARSGHWEASFAYIKTSETLETLSSKTQQSYARLGIWYSY